MDIEKIFGDTKKLNEFYTKMAGISEMAVSKHANLLIANIIHETARLLHGHEEASKKLIAMGADLADKAAKSEQERALDKDAQAEQETQESDKDDVSKGCADPKRAGVRDNMPNCSEAL